MREKQDKIFTPLEIDTLQEIMNIAFGQAAAELSEIINIMVVLSVPTLKVFDAYDLHRYITNEIKDFDSCNIVQQDYIGNSKGIAFLIFSHSSKEELISLFQPDNHLTYTSDLITETEKEIFTEIGNILIGACIGKMSELLNDNVQFLPPRCSIGKAFSSVYKSGAFFNDQSFAISLKTVFTFEGHPTTGYLFLVNSQESVSSLKKALEDFWKEYE
ncbi:chemotaxis protein CheC [Candidatus Magnetomonas plexicatena]|uniref:chemotaxis protein CheC n=1 Tax=Candidatus Magnetomonas plexicatena TaxID=2552947 RepID=UPI0011021B51|nr:chemotaxis protein CheC [Nitrospirales bacterium LBB_01]